MNLVSDHLSYAAYAVAQRMEKTGLLDPDLLVELRPVCLPGNEHIHYVLLYYNAVGEKPFAFLHFMENSQGDKSAALIEKMQEDMGGWGYREFMPNFLIIRHLEALILA